VCYDRHGGVTTARGGTTRRRYAATAASQPRPLALRRQAARRPQRRPVARAPAVVRGERCPSREQSPGRKQCPSGSKAQAEPVARRTIAGAGWRTGNSRRRRFRCRAGCAVGPDRSNTRLQRLERPRLQLVEVQPGDVTAPRTSLSMTHLARSERAHDWSIELASIKPLPQGVEVAIWTAESAVPQDLHAGSGGLRKDILIELMGCT